jgi:hypothetical protein
MKEGYQWDCPNCGERITSFYLPPTLGHSDAAEVERLRVKVEDLREALVEAREDVAEWGAYASPYFQEKWDLAGDLARIDAALSSTEAVSNRRAA